MPMIGPMIAGGILKGILVILTTAGVLTKTDGTYLVLYAASDAIMYFMPIIVGFSCGKIFDCNPYTTAAIGAALVYPDLVAAIVAEGGITFLHIPVSTTTYANTLFPIILASFFASKVEKWQKSDSADDSVNDCSYDCTCNNSTAFLSGDRTGYAVCF